MHGKIKLIFLIFTLAFFTQCSGTGSKIKPVISNNNSGTTNLYFSRGLLLRYIQISARSFQNDDRRDHSVQMQRSVRCLVAVRHVFCLWIVVRPNTSCAKHSSCTFESVAIDGYLRSTLNTRLNSRCNDNNATKDKANECHMKAKQMIMLCDLVYFCKASPFEKRLFWEMTYVSLLE